MKQKLSKLKNINAEEKKTKKTQYSLNNLSIKE